MKYLPREECLINALGDDNGESDMPLAKLKQRSKPEDSPQAETVTYIIGVMHILIFCVVLFLLRSHFKDGSCTLGGALLKAVSHFLPHPGPELHGVSEEGPYLEIYGLLSLPVLSQISIPCSPPVLKSSVSFNLPSTLCSG